MIRDNDSIWPPIIPMATAILFYLQNLLDIILNLILISTSILGLYDQLSQEQPKRLFCFSHVFNVKKFDIQHESFILIIRYI